MSVDYTGEAFVRHKDVRYSQDTGFAVSYREQGIPSHIIGREADYQRAGYDTLVTGTGPYRQLIAWHNIHSALYGAITRWTIATETVEKPIWTLPAVKAEADAYSYTDPNGQLLTGPAAYRKGIEEAANTRTSLGAAYAAQTVAANVHQELLRGVQAYEHDYTILTRNLTFDPRKQPRTIQLGSTRYIYTTAQLEAQASIPAQVMFELPTDGAADVQAMWGWRIRDQEAEVNLGQTSTHRTSWVYANWSTFLYTAFP